MATASTSRLLPCCRAALRNANGLRNYATAAPAAASSLASDAASTSQLRYKRPLKEGKNPMYDLAVSYIAKDTQEQLAKAEELTSRLKDLEDGEEKRQLAQEVEGLHVAAYLNDPETRWNFDNGLGMSACICLTSLRLKASYSRCIKADIPVSA